MIEVYADIACPFAHATLRQLDAYRRDHDADLRFRVRAWPLEVVNGTAHDGEAQRPEVDAIRDGVAGELFAGFEPSRFPRTTLPALAAEAAAYRSGDDVGDRFALAIRDVLWEKGQDVSDPLVLEEIRTAHGVPVPVAADDQAVRRDLEEGRARGAEGSPHVFTASGNWFNPTLHIDHDGDAIVVSFDRAGFETLVRAVA